MMATWRVILTFLAFFAIALVLCDGRHALGAGVSSLLEKRAAAQASDPVPAPAKGDKKCEKPLDVVFVLDSSEKVGTENWKKIVNATIDMASEFDIKTARFAVVQYTNFPETPIKLISFKDDKSFGETLKKVFYKTGGKRTDLALNSTLGVFKAASPRLGSKVVILITGGPSADVYTDASKPPITGLDLLQQPVQQLQDAEVAVYAVGVHEGITDEKKTFGEQLKLIASEPKDDHMIKVGDYSNLADVASKIAKKACIVNGGWSKWSEWSVCRHPCMVKLRTRECNNPAPESGGLNCTGSKVEQYPCGSPVECQSSTAAPPPPTGVVSYGTPDANVCGNGYELITLTDAQLDASSSYAEGPNDQVKQQSRVDHMPSMGKVNNTAGRGAWCADHSKAVAKDKNQYLMVDLYKPGMKVGMVETQGQSAYDNSVTKFSLSFSNDGVNWTPYGKVLTGNDDRDTRVDNHLNPAIETRFIRFIPSDWLADDICMRVAIFKCREPHLVPPKKDQPEDAWADKWANAARKSHVEKAKLIFKGQQQKKH
ncbi:PREDICTED: coadhesin-like isoform X2 [Acropora digitifera]|uniref:coadhesin-like isoform X2 n=1 Tax=Acropora digitifera TaxID=70779 RepID=UPI00077A23FA|nr:PREDICTED: coadhesin-like isoform X2 [Acropora digitifera]